MRGTDCRIGHIFDILCRIADFSTGINQDQRKPNFQSSLGQKYQILCGKNEKGKKEVFRRRRAHMPNLGLKESSLPGLSEYIIFFHDIKL